MIPFSELLWFKAPIRRPSAQKQDIAVFWRKKCAILRFVLMLDKLINLEKGSSKFKSYWEHLADFSPELFVAIDRFVPFRANQPASQGRLQIYAAQDDLLSFMTLRKEIPPVLSAWALSKVQALHFSFHFWRHVSKWFLKDWPWHPDFSVFFQFAFQGRVFATVFCALWMLCLDDLEGGKNCQNHPS